ncbi:Haloacid dehydrogenase (HAD) superfamily protein [Orpheovirus IHUMI-LCC2]|uniref:Haloacid dehydrogenase (HAD) superfamily protein n=1 Tax=Orpheovirus IHUMI-LCC2 TaxID=2023057 RepID=A0A2I2L541_9VIRU|nr:Haloacid dehydrogenase (HAD) superfamily protein [Orpheovirus IHUMI-LCC2]SNW62644.1 Haloacid dehydrogenase (HAD) superfamily protein [Orpheovirus IHUMI-LCC2]
MPPGKTFYRTYTSKDCDIYKVIGKQEENVHAEICIKNLYKIIKEIPYASINNIIIVDDSRIPCVLNLQNHLSIAPFEGKKSDVELQNIILKLESILAYHYVYQSLPSLDTI